MSEEKSTYRVKIKHEVLINVQAESGAAAARIVKAMKPRISSPFDLALGEGKYTDWESNVIVRAMNMKCKSCGYWQHGMKKGSCGRCRSAQQILAQEAEAEGGEL